MESTTQQRPQLGGLATVFIDLVVSIAGYYVLRAVGVGVIWALAIPGIVVGVLTLLSSLRRRKLDVVGVLVLIELAAALTLSLVTKDARIAACRQPFYVLIGGLFCLSTLFGRKPFTAGTTASMATFGDPVRARAFELAWQDVPAYRQQQRKLTIAIGSIMSADAVVRVLVIYGFPASRMDLSLLLSNIAGILMFVIVGVVAKTLIMPARQIVLGIVEQLKAESGEHGTDGLAQPAKGTGPSVAEGSVRP